MISRRKFNWIYVGLWTLRICFALLGTGYIHPDEHMQNGEVTSGDLMPYHTIRTWEWSTALPVRSIVPAFATTGIPLWFAKFFIEKHLTQGVHPILLFRLERSAFLVISGLIDYSLVRPFSNSIEAVLVALSLLFLRKISRVTMLHKSYYLHLLAITFVAGIFTRPTFLIFGAPIAYQVALVTLTHARTAIRWLRLVVPPLFTAVGVCAAFLVADTLYFRGTPNGLVVTPFNFLMYNFASQNLAEHGLHPRWLHVFVNLPMLFGPWVTWLVVRVIVDSAILSNERNGKSFEVDVLRSTIIQMIILSLTVLSLQPHQEPRFLVPLLLPIIVLVANTGRLAHVGKAFWVSCSIFNFVLAVLFGILHQGGVVPSLFHLHSLVADPSLGTRTNIIYWKTYMPPLHLLGVNDRDVVTGSVSFIDLAGASRDDFAASLDTGNYDRTFVVTPVAMRYTLPPTITSCMELNRTIFPHLDLDHISESMDIGVLDGLRLGVYTLSRNCIFV
ncbi:glycosyltransferase family 22 protein [Suillus bovinus]|uniref:glycosyltransferase family 22 protein n=1 Tax=Suillus bovinus TaxID=48563 RepID=UPI001B85E22B|nr:glycosyltransferase family 22 protein [Suillus bovinus]KAG2159341.1 glycosyltransferase family 22 protein [Suillus bovinus]